MKIKIEYDDGVPFAMHRIEPGDAEAWRERFEDAVSKTTGSAGTAGDLRGREFATDLVNATRAALMSEEEGDRLAAPSPAEVSSPPAMPPLPAVPAGAQLPSQNVSDALRAAEESLQEVPAPKPAGMLKVPRAVGTFVRKVWRGDYGLARTFWGLGLGVSIAVGLLLSSLGGGEAVLVGVLHLGYTVVVLVGIWRAATQYEGLKIWSILAKASVVLVPGLLVLGLSLGWLWILALAGLPH